jgi:hypothetical protein
VHEKFLEELDLVYLFASAKSDFVLKENLSGGSPIARYKKE